MARSIARAEAFARAEAVAVDLKLPHLELDVLRFSQYVIGFQLDLEEAVAIGDRAIALAQELNEPQFEAIAQFFNAGQHWYGKLEEAEKHSRALRALAERLRIPYTISNAAHALVQHASTRGDWDASQRILEWGMDEGSPDVRLFDFAAEIAFRTGNVELGRRYLQRAIDFVASVPPGPNIEYLNLALMAAEAVVAERRDSDVEIVRRAARAVLSSPVPGTKLFVAQACAALGVVAAATNDKATAAEVLPQLEAIGSLAMGTCRQSDHVRGLVLETLGRMDEAIVAIEAGLAFLPQAYRPGRAAGGVRLRAHPPQARRRGRPRTSARTDRRGTSDGAADPDEAAR